jgi:hypothetical protein
VARSPLSRARAAPPKCGASKARRSRVDLQVALRTERLDADAGRPYNPGLSQSPYEIHRYLKPLDPKAGVVRFWSDESPVDAFFRPSEAG